MKQKSTPLYEDPRVEALTQDPAWVANTGSGPKDQYQFVAVLRSRSCLEPPLLGCSRSRFFCSTEPPFLRRLWLHLFSKQKRKSLLLWVVTKHYLKAVYHVKCDPKKTCINNSLFKSSKWTMLVHGAGAVWSRLFLSGVEPIQFSRSRLRDFGLPESVPGLWTSGAGAPQKIGGYATLVCWI